MPIVRAEHKKDFTQIINNLLNDKRLSYGARGLMAHALTHYDDWVFNGEDYFITEVDKKTKVRSYIKELVQNGYLKRIANRTDRGIFQGYKYEFHEKPFLDLPFSEKPILDNPNLDNHNMDKTIENTNVAPFCDLPFSDEPFLEKPFSENHKLNNTNITNININKKEKVTSIDKIIDSYTNNSELRNTLKEFLKMRKSIKKPMTDKAMTLLINKLDKLSSSDNEKVEILNQSILNSWQGIFELKDKKISVSQDKKPKPKLLGWD